MTRLGAAMDGKGDFSFSAGGSETSDASRVSALPPAAGGDPKKETASRRTSGAGALTGLLGIVCALLGVVSAPSLFLPLAVAFSAFSLLRSLAVLSLLGTVAAALSCILTVVGLVLFPWGIEEGGRAAAASSAVPAAATSPVTPVVPVKPAEPDAATGTLSMPPPTAPPTAPRSEAAPPVSPPAEAAKPAPAPSSAALSESPPAPRLEDALPEPPPPAAAVVPDTPASTATPTPLEAEKPAETSKAAKTVDLQPWPESRTEQTKAIQVLLRDLDFYHGTTNGTFGPATRAAICLYLVTYNEKGECEPTEALFESLQKRRAATNVGNAPR